MKVLLLEDDQDRVNWFLNIVPAGTDLIWTYTVRDFLSRLVMLYNSPELALILLDHDLFLMKRKEMMKTGKIGKGWDDYFTDINGECGTTAVNKMPKVYCPVIVHSANEEDGPKMHKTLLKRGMQAFYLPYHMRRGDLQKKIVEILKK